MKIERIALQDFKCFEDLDIRFTKPVNLIFGENASGKTTIAQAIALALTGRINGGCDRRPLVRHETGDFSVAASFMQNGTPGRLEQYETTQFVNARESTDPETIFRELETNRETLSALLDATNFLNLHPDEKKRIMFDLLPDLKVDAENMATHLTAWLNDQPDLLRKCGIAADEDLMQVLSSPPSLEEAYNQAYEERRIARRELKILGDPKVGDTLRQGVPLGMTRERVETRLDEKHEKLASLHVAVGETKGIAAGERRQIERELSRIAEELERLETLLSEADPAALEAQLDDLEKQRLVVVRDIQTLKDDYAALQREAGKLLARKEQEDRSRTKAKSLNGRCPAFPEVTCRTKEVASRIAAAVSDNAELSAAIEERTGKTEEVLRLLKENEEALNGVNGGIAAAKNALARVTEGRKKESDLRAKRRELEAVLAAVGEDKAAETERLKERIAVLEGQIREGTEHMAAIEKAERIRNLEERANKLEILTLAFSPKGIMSGLMKGAAASLTVPAGDLMAELTGGRCTLEIDLEEGFRIYLCDCETGMRTEAGLASASERFRIGIVLQAVLSELAGLRFMVIDGIDVLDQTNRGFFFQFLRKVLPRFDQIIGFCTVGPNPPKNPGLPEMDFFIIEENQVRRIAA